MKNGRGIISELIDLFNCNSIYKKFIQNKSDFSIDSFI